MINTDHGVFNPRQKSDQAILTPECMRDIELVPLLLFTVPHYYELINNKF